MIPFPHVFEFGENYCWHKRRKIKELSRIHSTLSKCFSPRHQLISKANSTFYLSLLLMIMVLLKFTVQPDTQNHFTSHLCFYAWKSQNFILKFQCCTYFTILVISFVKVAVYQMSFESHSFTTWSGSRRDRCRKQKFRHFMIFWF